MLKILNDANILNIINCVFQGIIAVSAVVAIWITIGQISGKAKIKLKMKTEFRLNETEGGEFIVELVIHMVNLGMAPVYISSSGIELWRHRKCKYKMRISNESFVLKSGESKTVCGKYFSEMIDDVSLLSDSVKTYATCQMDKIVYEKKECSYDEFKHKWESADRKISELKQRSI